jgi:DUF4097 and DUF4098 domain-containing protein YvlB
MRKLILATSCLLCATSAFAEIERIVEKTFQVKDGQCLKIDTFSGPIEVRTGAPDQVKLVLREKIDADSESEADEMLSKLSFNFETNTDGVFFQAKRPEKGLKNFFGSWKDQVHLRWTVTVPHSFSVDLDTAGGRILVGDLQGKVRADTSGGSIDIGEIDGSVSADTSGGSITLKSASGRTVLDTSGGSIHVGVAKSSLVADTSGGSIEVACAEDRVKADTSGGGIEVGFRGPIKGESSLDTSGGGITVRVDADAAFDLVADTSGGNVKCELPIQTSGEMERDHLEGRVNGGGPKLRLDASGGGIRIRKN